MPGLPRTLTSAVALLCAACANAAPGSSSRVGGSTDYDPIAAIEQSVTAARAVTLDASDDAADHERRCKAGEGAHCTRLGDLYLRGLRKAHHPTAAPTLSRLAPPLDAPTPCTHPA